MQHQEIIKSIIVMSLLMLTRCGQSDTRLPAAPLPSVATSATSDATLSPLGADEGELTPRVPTPVVPTPPLVAPTPDVYQSYPDYGLIVQFQTQIADPSISEPAREVFRRALENELRAAEARATRIALGSQTPLFPIPTSTPIVGEAPFVLPRGLMAADAASAIDYRSTACTDQMWQDVIGEFLIQVYACAMRADLGQGVILVDTFPVEQTPGKVYGPRPATGPYPTPRRVGPVRIVAAQAHQLTIQADDGTTFIFDVDTLQFITSATGTITPVPTATPTVAVTTAIPADSAPPHAP